MTSRSTWAAQTAVERRADRAFAPYPGEDQQAATALRDAARAAVGGDATSAFERVRAAVARGDRALFATIAEHLVQESPFDARFVARALTLLQGFTIDEVLETEGKLRARVRSLAQSARRDSLTGIANRRTLDESLATELRRAARYRSSLSVLFIDIDHFKRVNDSYGHAVGDRVLRDVTSTIRQVLRPGDVFGRYGGEEFVVGLVNADARAALRTAERLRRDVEHAKHEDGAHGARVTISVGVATRGPNDDGLSIDTLVGRSDEAMLAAKASGRNMVCAWCDSKR